MWRKSSPLVITLLFPALLMAKGKGSSNYIKEIIETYGTYLSSDEPMTCGSKELDDDEKTRIKNLFKKVSGWPNFRIKHTMGIWDKDVSKCHVPLKSKQCLSRLKKADVDFKQVFDAKGVFNPVELTGKMNGVKLVSEEDPIIVDCDFALAMLKLTKILSEMNVKAIGVMSAHRPESKYSFHTLGLALDINWFKSSEWTVAVWVQSWFEKRDKHKTCKYKPVEERGRFLMNIACALWEDKVFNTILTPNYNPGHYNHFHVDLRPGDNRFYLN